MNADRSAELGAFLTARRAAVTPESVGLPGGGRRRVAGLRREEVAMLAGVGVTWYTWLEQGRPVSASTQVLDALARLYRLSTEEHDYLYRLAGVPNARTGSRTGGPAGTDPGGRKLLELLGNSPAAAFSERFDVLDANTGFDLLFPGIRGNHGLDGNALFKLGRAADSQNPVSDPEFLAALVTQVRHAYAHHVGDPEWESFIAEITSSSAVIAEAWASHTVARPVTEHRFHCPPVGWIRFTSARYLLDSLDGTFVMIYVPAEETSQQQFEEIVRLGGVRFDR